MLEKDGEAGKTDVCLMLSVSITKGQHTTVLVLVELACSSSRGEGEGKDVC